MTASNSQITDGYTLKILGEQMIADNLSDQLAEMALAALSKIAARMLSNYEGEE